MEVVRLPRIEVRNVPIFYFQFILRTVFNSRDWEWADHIEWNKGEEEAEKLMQYRLPSFAASDLVSVHELMVLHMKYEKWTEIGLFREDFLK